MNIKYGGFKVEVYNINTKETIIYNTMKEAIKILNISYKTLVKYAKNDKIYNDIYKFKRSSKMINGLQSRSCEISMPVQMRAFFQLDEKISATS
jgi:hypothetical protein